MEFVIGDFVVLPFGPVTDAAGIHTALKEKGLDAAIVDNAYLLSRLQLAAALARIAPLGSVTPATVSTLKQRKTAIQEKMARLIFVALSLTHNLDKVLQVLPPGPGTTAVVAILHRPAATPEVLDAVRHICAPRLVAQTTESSAAASSSAGGGNVAAEALAVHCDVAKTMSFYKVTAAELSAATAALSAQDRQDAERRFPAARAVELRALEACVVSKLATYDV